MPFLLRLMTFSLHCMCVCVNRAIPLLHQAPPKHDGCTPHPSFTTQKTRTVCTLTFEGLWEVTGEAHGPTSQPDLCPKDLQGWQRCEKGLLCERQEAIGKGGLGGTVTVQRRGRGCLKPKSSVTSQGSRWSWNRQAGGKRTGDPESTQT